MFHVAMSTEEVKN